MLTANGQLCHTATCEHHHHHPVPCPGKSNLLLAAVGPITQRPGNPRSQPGKGREGLFLLKGHPCLPQNKLDDRPLVQSTAAVWGGNQEQYNPLLLAGPLTITA